MGIPAGSRWWIATLLVVGALLVISALALDRPNVVWDHGAARCPYCRRAVEPFSSRCGSCRGDFDWVVSLEEESPISNASLSVLEAEWVNERVRALGPEVAAARVAAALGLSPAAATEYLGSVGRGDCGYCGGTRKDLASPNLASPEPCPLCLGSGASIACGGDRRVRLGDRAAEQALQAYEEELEDLLRSHLPGETVREEGRRLAERFLKAHAGTVQAARVYFWPRLEAVTADGASGPRDDDLAVRVMRARLDALLAALRADG